MGRSKHKKFEKLDTFYYMKSQERADEYEESKEYLYSSGDLKSKDAKALLNGEPAADGKIDIKIENPEFVSMKNKHKVLVSAKARMAGVLDKCKDVLSQFENKKVNSPEDYKTSEEVHTEFEEKVKTAGIALEDLRILVLLVCLIISNNI